jgi:tetratricopeptide (TPR) repeat protein
LAEAQYDASQVQPAADSMERALHRMQGDLTLPREHYIAALSFLGNAWSMLENETRATEVYGELLKLNPRSLLARFELGRLALDRGDYSAAQKSLELAH